MVEAATQSSSLRGWDSTKGRGKSGLCCGQMDVRRAQANSEHIRNYEYDLGQYD